MKKAIAITLFLIYALSMSGIAISGHFCGEKLRAIHIMKHGGDFHAKQCCKSDKMDGGCCEDKTIKIDVKQHHFNVDKLVKHQTVFSDYIQPVLALFISSPKPNCPVLTACHSQPTESPPIYLLNRVLLI